MLPAKSEELCSSDQKKIRDVNELNQWLIEVLNAWAAADSHW